MEWKLTEVGFDSSKISHLGNKFLIANGYMGVRGTLEEYDKSHLVAVNLAGVYDLAGDGWREPVNAPNAFYSYLEVDGKILKLPETEPKSHCIELDYRHGLFKRKTKWSTNRGDIILESQRFVNMKNVHLGHIKYKIKADFHADVKFVIGIDGNVWDINGPHFDSIACSDKNEMLIISGITHEKKSEVVVTAIDKETFPCQKEIIRESKRILKTISFVTDTSVEYEIEKNFCIYTSEDTKECKRLAKEEVIKNSKDGYAKSIKEHLNIWEKMWELSEVIIEGDDEAMEALNYSVYHLQSIAPRHTDSLSIPARGLSGQTYKGAVFWDTEMFMMDFYLMTNPKVAKSLVKYRIDALHGARKKAKNYGYEGAFYAWESQEEGIDACSDYNVTDVFTKRPMRTFFKDKQIHISAAIVYAIGRYIELTGDTSILKEGGAQTIIECAKFYYSMLLKKVGKKQYELHDVIGPDEYHERVNNNGYTNRMAKYTFEEALKVIEIVRKDVSQNILEEIYNLEELKIKFKDAAENMYIPKPDDKKIIPQFDGYMDLEDVSVDTVKSRLIDPKEYWGGAYGVASQTQIIKQADVITWLNLFDKDFPEDINLENWKYYEPRTEHGSSLSACMYAMLACKCKMPEEAYPLFIKSAKADILEGGKEWAGLVYIGGTHPAAEGGAYMVAIRGFAGINFQNGNLVANPSLPKKWKSMAFNICYRNKIYKVFIEGENVNIKLKN